MRFAGRVDQSLSELWEKSGWLYGSAELVAYAVDDEYEKGASRVAERVDEV